MWTQFRGGPTHPGAGPGAVAIRRPELAWAFDTGGVVESSPTIADGIVYCGTFANHLFALDARSGAELWRFRVEGLVRASPSVAHGMVFFGADDDRFHALDARTGAARWSLALGPGGEQSSPAIVRGICYFGAFDHHVYAADARTGDVRWKFATGGEILSSPAVADGAVLIGSRDGNLYALDADTGAERWRAQTGAAVWSSPAIHGGRAFFGSDDGFVYAIDAATGAVIWRYATRGAVFASPVIAPPATGPAGRAPTGIGPAGRAPKGELLYVGSDDHYLYALTTADGAERWRVNLGGRVLGSAAWVGDYLYVGGEGAGGDRPGAMFAVDRRVGEIAWRFETGATTWSSPTLFDDGIYFGAHDGVIRKLRDRGAAAGLADPPAGADSAGPAGPAAGGAV